MNGAEILVRCLQDQGVKHVFGIPGNHTLPVYAALEGSNITHVLGTHEPGLGYMADGYGRVTATPGVLLLTAGPGALNAVNAVAQAYVESSPVVVIAATCDMRKWGKGLYHELEHPEVQTNIYREVTKLAVRICKASEIPAVMERAFTEATSGRPRPVYVEIPENVFREQGEYASRPHAKAIRTNAPHAGVKAAVDILLSAKNPVVYAGGGVRSSGAAGEVIALCETLKIPVATSMMAKGAIPESFEYSLGCGAGMLGTDASRELLKGVDAMLAIGTRFNEIGTGFFTLPVPKNLIHVDIDAKEIGRNYKAAVALVGDAKAVTAQILEETRKRGPRKETGTAETIRLLKEAEYKKLLDEVEKTGDGINPLRAVHMLGERAERDAMVFADAGNSSVWVLGHPQLRFETIITPAGYNSMGFALPAAIAAKIAHPHRESIAVLGDGSFLMTGTEFLTAVRCQAPVKAVVLHDGGYNTLKFFQDVFCGGRHYETDITTFDFAKFAQDAGGVGIEVKTNAALSPGMDRLMEADKPAVLDVHVDPSATPWISRRMRALFAMVREKR
jgi:acetolactate synthase I/II/III large subunit